MSGLVTGLQNQLERFDSARRLRKPPEKEAFLIPKDSYDFRAILIDSIGPISFISIRETHS